MTQHERSKHWLIHGLLMIMVLLIAPMTFNTTADRFTYEDGVALYIECHDFDVDIPGVYGDKQTEFRKFLDSIKK